MTTADANPTPTAAPTGFEDVVAKALPSVVLIRSERGLGSGVVFDSAGHVVTNAHVVAGFRRFRVTLADGSEHAATLRGSFREGDLAVVQLAARGRSPPSSPTRRGCASASTRSRSATRSGCARA